MIICSLVGQKRMSTCQCMSTRQRTSTHVNTRQHTSTHVNTCQRPTSTWETDVRIILLYHVISCYIMLYHVISCSTVSCYISWSVKGYSHVFQQFGQSNSYNFIGQSQAQAVRQHHDRLKDVWPRLSWEGVKVSSDRIAQDISRHSWKIYEWSC